MGTITIQKTWNANGDPANADAMVLADPTGTFGVQDQLGNSIVAAGTPLELISTGLYSYSIPDVSDSASYTVWIKTTYLGSVRYSGIGVPPSANLLPLIGTTVPGGDDVRLAPGCQYGAYQTTITVTDAEGNSVVLTGRSLEMQFYDPLNPSAELFAITTAGSSGDNLVIDTVNTDQLQINIAATDLQSAGVLRWLLWDMSTPTAPVGLIQGTLPITTNPAP